MSHYLKSISLIFAVLLLGCTAQKSTQEAVAKAETNAVYYLVRHAEKTAEKDNPGLTEAGYKRAEDLAARLADVPLTKIYSSDYIRTRDTAAPVLKAKKKYLAIYDPSDLESFAAKLLSERGHILVIGHSNTTPPLSNLLGGQAGEPIVEATEYNRLYVVTRNADTVTSVIETFGE